jgi:predicted DNA-binding protein YlxM (UPF0122 family)
MADYLVRSVDPTIIESTYSEDVSEFDEFEEDQISLADLKPFLSQLPPKEVDLIEMYYGLRKKQKEIADFFNVSQGAISHRLSRAKKRLKFLRDMPKVDDRLLLSKLNEHFDDLEVDIIFNMVKTTCQSKTAEIVNDRHRLDGKNKMTQVKVRHKFDKSIEHVKNVTQNDASYGIILDLLKCIRENPYMLHEVLLPHFDKGSKVTL